MPRVFLAIALPLLAALALVGCDDAVVNSSDVDVGDPGGELDAGAAPDGGPGEGRGGPGEGRSGRRGGFLTALLDVDQMLDDFDEDGDEKLSREELEKWAASVRERMQSRRGGRGGEGGGRGPGGDAGPPDGADDPPVRPSSEDAV